MAWHGFGRTLIFGALAAAGWPLLMALTSWLWAPVNALAVYLVGLSAVYVAGLGDRPRRALRCGILTLVVGALAVTLGPGLFFTVLGAAGLLGFGRLLLLNRDRPARGLTMEVAVLGAGLLLAGSVAGPEPLQVSLAIWVFFLAQSLYFLAPGRSTSNSTRHEVDPFDVAAHRIDELLRHADPAWKESGPSSSPS